MTTSIERKGFRGWQAEWELAQEDAEKDDGVEIVIVVNMQFGGQIKSSTTAIQGDPPTALADDASTGKESQHAGDEHETGVQNKDEAFASVLGLDTGRKGKQETRVIYLDADLSAQERTELNERIVRSAGPGIPFVVKEGLITMRLPGVDQEMKLSQGHIKPCAMPDGTRGKFKVDPAKDSLLSGTALYCQGVPTGACDEAHHHPRSKLRSHRRGPQRSGTSVMQFQLPPTPTLLTIYFRWSIMAGIGLSSSTMVQDAAANAGQRPAPTANTNQPTLTNAGQALAVTAANAGQLPAPTVNQGHILLTNAGQALAATAAHGSQLHLTNTNQGQPPPTNGSTTQSQTTGLSSGGEGQRPDHSGKEGYAPTRLEELAVEESASRACASTPTTWANLASATSAP